MKNILAIIGCGELGMQIANYAIQDNHFNEVVFFDDFNNDDKVNGFKIFGKINDIEYRFKKEEFNEVCIGIGYNHMQFRKQIFDRFHGVIPFAKIIHSTCFIDKTSIIEEGTVIYPHSVIDKNVKIGQNVLINLNSIVSHDSVINAHTIVAPQVAIAGFVDIGEGCILGINCTIIDNVNIAAGIQIGGGSVVIKSISKKGLYVGNPLRFIR